MSFLQMMIKPFLPSLRKELVSMIESFIVSLADEKELNPYELSATISKKGDIAEMEIFDKENNLIEKTDAGVLIEEIFNAQLKVMPQIIVNQLLPNLDGNPIRKVVVDALDKTALLASYNEKQQLVFHEVTADSVKPIDIDSFLAENLSTL